jgi:hypothetical protein
MAINLNDDYGTIHTNVIVLDLLPADSEITK